jgi:hypothetical protein
LLFTGIENLVHDLPAFHFEDQGRGSRIVVETLEGAIVENVVPEPLGKVPHAAEIHGGQRSSISLIPGSQVFEGLVLIPVLACEAHDDYLKRSAESGSGGIEPSALDCPMTPVLLSRGTPRGC